MRQTRTCKPVRNGSVRRLPKGSSKSSHFTSATTTNADYMTMYGHEQLLSPFCGAARINQSLGRAKVLLDWLRS